MTKQPSQRSEKRQLYHTVALEVLPFIAYGLSLAFVIFGPFAWWLNYFTVGALWGITTPLQVIVRGGLKYVTTQFRDPARYSWWDAFSASVKEEISDLMKLSGLRDYLIQVVVSVFTWAVVVPTLIIIFGQSDYG